MKRIFAPVTLALCAGLFIGCESLTEPEAAVDETSLESSFDITSEAAQTSLLQAAGVNVDSANGFFIVNWHEHLRPGQTETILSGRANAVSYGATQAFPRSRVPGVDMGDVSVAVNQTNFALPKLESPFAGVRYGSMEKPRGRGPGGRGPGGSGPGGSGGHGPGGNGQGPRGGNPPAGVGLDSLNIPFVGSGTYQFAASGSSEVSAMNLDIQAPAALAQIGGVANDDTISTSQDLTITWTPDATVSNLTLVVAPARERGRFPRGTQDLKPMMITLDPAAGSYTITAQTLQDALGDAQGAMLHLNQGTVRQVTNTDGTKYIVALHSNDGVRVRVN